MKEIKLIKKEDAIVRKITESYSIFSLLTKDVIGNAKDHSEMARNKISDRIYYVLKGQLIVKHNDKKLIANPGDLIFIPANTWYEFYGTFKAVLINAPAFDPKYDEYRSLRKSEEF